MSLGVTHVITGLERGGAETLLVRALESIPEGEVASDVISLTGRGVYADAIEALGFEVRHLGMHSIPRPWELRRLRKELAERDPDLIQTWLLHANVIAGLPAARLGLPVVWGVHVSEIEKSRFGARAALVGRAERRLSATVPDLIIACSQRSEEAMLAAGYRADRIVTIPNGFDLDRFSPDRSARDEVRRDLGIDNSAQVVGHVARLHPLKDHRAMLEAAGRALERVPEAIFVLCGEGVEPGAPEIADVAKRLGDRARLLGDRSDVARIYAACDLFVSSSLSEALPLAVGEAMASGVPVVATDVGDSAELVGDTGMIVPPGSPSELATAIVASLDLPSERLDEQGAAARRRIHEHYRLDLMAGRYVEAWYSLTNA